MDKLQAEQYLGKTVYVVDLNFGVGTITPCVIQYMEEASNNEAYMYKLKDVNGKLVEHYYDTWYDAHQSLVKYHERQVDYEMAGLNKVLEMESPFFMHK